MPETTLNDEFGRAIAQTVLTYGFRSAIEIGSWDGSGSTAILASTLGKHVSPRLVAIESDRTRFERLTYRYRHDSWIYCHHGSSISQRSLTPQCFADVWQSPHNGLRYPEEAVAGWWQEFVGYMAGVPVGYLEETPGERFDVALIDGSEFTGWDEFRLLRDRVSCFMLDDAFHAYKCTQARLASLSDPQWHLVWASSYVRNGAAIFVKK
jgi:hypothetical protein